MALDSISLIDKVFLVEMRLRNVQFGLRDPQLRK
jgi:hypothetical protein